MVKQSKRIVVTGVGIVGPLGCGTEEVWRRLLAGQSGIRSLSAELTDGVPCTVGGQVPSLAEDPVAGFDPELAAAAKDRKKMDRFIEFSLVAAQEALTQAGWTPQDAEQQQRTATIIATGIGGFGAIAEAVRITDDRGPRRLSPFTVPSFLANLAAGHVSIRHGFKGPIGTPVTACAASVQAIGDAARLIRSGEADVALCGGSEAAIHRASLGGFAAARALATRFNDRPEQASRPFDQERDGFVMGEGAGLLVIESLEHALARGAHPLAELVGYGTSADAYHLTAGPEDGDGARRSMEQALRQAGLSPSQIQHINAHATSTSVGDKGELAAIRAVFGTTSCPTITSTKSSTGHLLGAAGGIEAIFTVLALRDQVVPPTLNLTTPDALAEGLDLVGPSARQMPIEYALSNGFGFGGVNASVIFRRWGQA
ncbi:beta-ketoacyl-[acyl-carrier-protein] synthase II [Pseudomonas daroniae]|uniref:3-oxoacyl-[acyl-carrier-protein] synthase 2 n=1 Tax=Phytopseudomonas daroniae TaxID=2487519 RepID=A0A4Q9QH28_9GAMM|nr:MULTISPECIES: beta-ketoacyl-ACP synthase II [Pseudomonas]TBU72470.1 beta-ketoacyl-[acyl-carrier-protein] synthase II [Pseudomonas daroniae]TBU73790.1 beta-ketoacyl-[acyl-carrier-protein] synthase II [Pseudomonas daroniae]TBU79541.1 beta-ketoacyl-[acyl-carrier-protein] synthase II [Pseudomonas sp. FRB 228]TBU88234.1 beta-ketoacyl-[acyl-carrier-protein] synthase II [Pseudomonas daroniae]